MAAGGATALDWFKAASPLLGGALGGAPPSSSATSSAYQNTSFDSSGWQVTTGQGSNSSTGSNMLTYVCIGAALLFGLKWLKR